MATRRLAIIAAVILGCSSDKREVEVGSPDASTGSGGGGASGSDASAGDAGTTGGSAGNGGALEEGGTSGSPGSGGLGALGQACGTVGALACAGHAGKAQLICDGVWMANGTCSGDYNCDTSPPNVGSCQPILSGCLGKNHGDLTCFQNTPAYCGPDLVTAQLNSPCSDPDAGAGTCFDGACVACTPGTKRCWAVLNYPASSSREVQSCSSEGYWGEGISCGSDACREAACTPPYAEGSLATPVPIGIDSDPYPGSVDGASSYYKAVLNSGLYVRIFGMTADVDVYVYSDAAFTNLLCSMTTAGTSPEQCDPVTQGTIYIRVDAKTPGGALFVLSVEI
jgi:hypothetical protein